MGFDNLNQIVAFLKQRYPQLGKRMNEARSVNHWETAVGPAIAKHARALRVVEGTLWVEVDHPIWRAELHHRKAQILAKLNSVAPGESDPIQDLFLVDPRKNR